MVLNIDELGNSSMRQLHEDRRTSRVNLLSSGKEEIYERESFDTLKTDPNLGTARESRLMASAAASSKE